MSNPVKMTCTDGILDGGFSSIEDPVSSLIEGYVSPPVLFAVIGDSRMANSFQKLSGDARRTRVMNQGIVAWLELFSGGRFNLPFDYDLAVSGATTTDILGQVPGILALEPQPSVCMVNGGTNDFGFGTYESLELAFSNITSAALQLRDNGITPIVEIDTPRNAFAWSDDAQLISVAYNRMLREWARKTGVLLADHEANFIQADGDAQTGYNVADGTHQSCTGVIVRAKKMLEVMEPLLQPYTPAMGSTLDLYDATLNPKGNLINGLMLGTGGSTSGTGVSGEVSDNWTSLNQSGTMTAVTNKESPREDGGLGDALVAEVDATTASIYRLNHANIDTTGIPEGTKACVTANIQITELSGNVDYLLLYAFDFSGTEIGSSCEVMKNPFTTGLNPLPNLPLKKNLGGEDFVTELSGMYMTDYIVIGDQITSTQFRIRIEAGMPAGSHIKFKLSDVQLRIVD